MKRFSEAYTKLKSGLEFYIPQIEEWKRQKYSLRKQYETALEEHTRKLMEEFTRLKQGYEDSASREIAKAVASVKANEKSAEEICAVGSGKGLGNAGSPGGGKKRERDRGGWER